MTPSPSSREMTEWVAEIALWAGHLAGDSYALEKQCRKVLADLTDKETKP